MALFFKYLFNWWSWGYPTIGYGHVVKEHENFSCGISEEEAEDLLRQDVGEAEKGVLRLIDMPLTDNQFNALVSFTFNLGSGALQRSTLRRKVNREEHKDVPAEFMHKVWMEIEWAYKALRGSNICRCRCII